MARLAGPVRDSTPPETLYAIVPTVPDADVTPAMCTTVGGNWMGLTNYMVHVWTAPRYANRYGVFHEQNPRLDCPDGTYYQIPWREMGDRMTTCVSG